MDFPEDLKYAANHEWVSADGTRIKMGISDYAQDALGDIVFVELPEVGRQVSAGESFAEVESTKSVSDVYSPVTGTVIAANEALDATPELVNSDPYGDGWFVVIEATDLSELDGLMDVVAYREIAS
jgi:glycine cleavage system H protein